MILWLLIIASPFSFEIKSGVSFEPIVGSSVADKIDPVSLNTGLRLSYLFADQRDRCFTIEAQGSWQLLPSAESGFPSNRILAEGNIVFYEFYNPFAFRLALGGGAERRDIETIKAPDWSWLGVYRGGLGYFLSKEVGIWFDVNQRQIFRQNALGKNYRTAPIEFTLSSQWIF